MKQDWKSVIPGKIVELYGKNEFYLYILLTLNAGLRPSESHALTWGDISKSPDIINNSQVGYINVSKALILSEDGYKITEPKTKASVRSVTVSWDLISEIFSVKNRGNDNERIFETPPTRYSSKWKHIKSALSLPASIRSWSMLRHFYITSIQDSVIAIENIPGQIGCTCLLPGVYNPYLYEMCKNNACTKAESDLFIPSSGISEQSISSKSHDV